MDNTVKIKADLIKKIKLKKQKQQDENTIIQK